ncbi:hypothetical protein E2C01_069991 [Portunus trituberculatus]|uniref:Uncharacterized protein n=1 Tax=Portunus trituberculatus TaxID=210409 RepID=A0A5B7HT22_PORTR|nr:hypothetical protein [Portunus trituberculatus]
MTAVMSKGFIQGGVAVRAMLAPPTSPEPANHGGSLALSPPNSPLGPPHLSSPPPPLPPPPPPLLFLSPP